MHPFKVNHKLAEFLKRSRGNKKFLSELDGFAQSDLKLTVIAVVRAEGFISVEDANLFMKKGRRQIVQKCIMSLSLYQ